MRIDQDVKLDFKDVLIRPRRSTLRSRAEVSVERVFKFKHVPDFAWTGVPIIAANMDTVGTFEVAKKLAERKCITAVHKHYSLEDWKTFHDSNPALIPYVAVSSGTGKADMEKLGKILDVAPNVRMICLDVANGYSEAFVDAVKKTREDHPTKVLMAGNVVTAEMTEELLLSGADIVKVGIGPGSVCTTRRQTGVGYPQLSAVVECAEAAHGLGGLIISDGGCTCPGDVCKALGAGSDFVMLGGMLAGHDESAGDLVEDNGLWFKTFYGMSSATAMQKHAGGVAEYRSSEGKTVKVPYRGPVDETIRDLLGGIRSACTYVGAKELKELSKRMTFIRVTQQLNQVFGEAKADVREPASKRQKTEAA
jgi:GMP reductase